MVEVALRISVPSRYRDGFQHAVGTKGRLVEPAGPEHWFVELRVPDDSLVGGAWYETVELKRDELDGLPSWA